MLLICSHKRQSILDMFPSTSINNNGVWNNGFDSYKLISKQSVASKISERIRQAVEDYKFVDGLRITISGGTSQYNNETITELVHSADKKLYTAKRNGQNFEVCSIKSWVIVFNAARRRNSARWRNADWKQKKCTPSPVVAAGVCIVVNQWAQHINEFRIWV